MKKKKLILIIILLVILALVILLLIHTIRNFIIIKNLQENVAQYLNSTNYHIKSSESDDSGTTMNIDYYQKDGKIAIIMERNQNGKVSKISSYEKDGKTNRYYDTEDSNVAELDTGSTIMYGVINYFDTANDFQTFVGSIMMKIEKTEYNGKECYLITDIPESIFLNSTEKNEIYIEKDTGLYVKSSNATSTGEREYEFDNVSDEVFEEPNLEGYEIRE